MSYELEYIYLPRWNWLTLFTFHFLGELLKGRTIWYISIHSPKNCMQVSGMIWSCEASLMKDSPWLPQGDTGPQPWWEVHITMRPVRLEMGLWKTQMSTWKLQTRFHSKFPKTIWTWVFWSYYGFRFEGFTKCLYTFPHRWKSRLLSLKH